MSRKDNCQAMTERQATNLLSTDPDNAPNAFQDSESGKWIGRVRGRYLTRSEIRIELEHAKDDRVPFLRGALHLIERAVKTNAQQLGFGRASTTEKTDTKRQSGDSGKRDRKDHRSGRLGFTNDDPGSSRLPDVRDSRQQQNDDRGRLHPRKSDSGSKAASLAKHERRQRGHVTAKKTVLKSTEKRSTVAPKKRKR